MTERRLVGRLTEEKKAELDKESGVPVSDPMLLKNGGGGIPERMAENRRAMAELEHGIKDMNRFDPEGKDQFGAFGLKASFRDGKLSFGLGGPDDPSVEYKSQYGALAYENHHLAELEKHYPNANVQEYLDFSVENPGLNVKADVRDYMKLKREGKSMEELHSVRHSLGDIGSISMEEYKEFTKDELDKHVGYMKDCKEFKDSLGDAGNFVSPDEYLEAAKDGNISRFRAEVTGCCELKDELGEYSYRADFEDYQKHSKAGTLDKYKAQARAEAKEDERISRKEENEKNAPQDEKKGLFNKLFGEADIPKDALKDVTTDGVKIEGSPEVVPKAGIDVASVDDPELGGRA